MKTSTHTLILGALLACSSQTASAFYNPSTGRWLSRDPVEEKASKNLYQFTANDPVSGYDLLGLVKRKCGVEVFRVFWDTPVSGSKPTAIATISVQLKFRKGGEYDPRCCEYKQLVKSGYKITLPGGTVHTDPTPPDLHDDDYSRGDDDDGKPDVADPGFETNDSPGLPPNAPLGSEVIWYEFTAEQIVYSPGATFKGGFLRRSCECEKNDEVAKKGPYTVRVIGGKVPGPYIYEGNPLPKEL